MLHIKALLPARMRDPLTYLLYLSTNMSQPGILLFMDR
jgi:hypothetical protein